MKQIFTLFAICVLCLLSNKSKSQFLEDFTNETSQTLKTACWTLNNVSVKKSNQENNTYLALTNSTAATFFQTSYIKPNSTNVTVSFSYRLDGAISGTLELRVFLGSTSIGKATLNASTPANTYFTSSIPTTLFSTAYDQQIRVEAVSTSGGNFRYEVHIDNLAATGLNNATSCTESPVAITLPVKLVNFYGSANKGNVQLNWNVEENETGNYFEIQKSSDGENFAAVATVKNTEKTGSETYRFADANFKGKAFYRLKIINKNASVTYSKVISFQDSNESNTSNLTLLQNPVTSSVRFSYAATTRGTATVNVYTTSGVRVSSTQIIVQEGYNQTALSPDIKMAPGSYILEVVNGSQRSMAKLMKL